MLTRNLFFSFLSFPLLLWPCLNIKAWAGYIRCFLLAVLPDILSICFVAQASENDQMASRIIQLLSDDGLTNLNITDNILCNLGIADIFALHATCRALRWLLGQMTESPYLLNVNTQLGHCLRDPSRFRYELGKCDGIICGEFVQNFLECNSQRYVRMQIVIQEGPKSCQFIEYLLSLEEITVDEIYDHEEYHLESTYDPYGYIWVKKTPKPPITELINGALTTVDLNFMTWNKAYSLLPVATVQKHKFYPLKPFGLDMGGATLASCSSRLDHSGFTLA